jgi:uncharacterized peroxidase-related enzyme
MSRISLVEPQNAPLEINEIYQNVLHGNPGSIQKALAHRPQILKTFLPFYASVGKSLDRKLYELIYLRVSFINECYYCIQHHVSSSKKSGLGDDDWKALKSGDVRRFNGKEQAALHYVEKLTRSPHGIGDDDFAELKKHFSDTEILDIHMLAGLANLTNRVTGPLDLELEFPEEKI